MKLQKKIKFIDPAEIRQKRGYLLIKNLYIPLAKNYFKKAKDILLDGLVYLFVLRLLSFELTWLNLLSAICLYMLAEDYKDYLLQFRRIKR